MGKKVGFGSDPRSKQISQQFMEDLMKQVIDGKDSDVTFDKFPFYLSERIKILLTSAGYFHLRQHDLFKHTKSLSPVSRAILLSEPTELYHHMLAKALAHCFESKLLYLDMDYFSLKMQGKDGCSTKEPHLKRSIFEATRERVSGLFSRTAPSKFKSRDCFQEKLFLYSLYKVLVSISQTGSVILYIKNIEKIFLRSPRMYNFFKKLFDKISGPVLILGSRSDNLKDDCTEVNEKLTMLFPYNVEIKPPQDKAHLKIWTEQLKKVMEKTSLEDKTTRIAEVFARNDIDCTVLDSISRSDMMLLSKHTEEIVASSIFYHLKNTENPEFRNGILTISATSLCHVLKLFQEGESGEKDENNNKKESKKDDAGKGKPISNGTKKDSDIKAISNGTQKGKDIKPISNGTQKDKDIKPISNGTKKDSDIKDVSNATRKDNDTKAVSNTTKKDNDTKDVSNTTKKDNDTKAISSATKKDNDTKAVSNGTKKDSDIKDVSNATKKDNDTKAVSNTTKKDNDTKAVSNTTKKDNDTKAISNATKKDNDTKAVSNGTKKDSDIKDVSNATKKDSDAKAVSNAAKKDSDTRASSNGTTKDNDTKAISNATKKDNDTKAISNATKKDNDTKAISNATNKDSDAKAISNAAKKDSDTRASSNGTTKDSDIKATTNASVPADNPYEKLMRQELIPANEIKVNFSDIGALDDVKESLQEAVMLPLRRPDFFKGGGLLKPCKGVLLFGPPGTGKTMLAKAIANEAGASFINVSPSTITGMYYGQSEKNVRALFSLAAKVAPTIIFIDEVDSLLGKRTMHEQNVVRSIKNEFMTHWDGLLSKSDEKIIVLGATNMPFALDEAVIRRFQRRIMVGLPSAENREVILKTLLAKEKYEDIDFKVLSTMTKGYSGSDLKNLCMTAAYRPVQELMQQERAKEMKKKKKEAEAKISEVASNVTEEDRVIVLRPLNMEDMRDAKNKVTPSFAEEGSNMRMLEEWNDQYGAGGSRKKKKEQLSYFL